MNILFKIGGMLALAVTIIKFLGMAGVFLPFGLDIIRTYSFVFYGAALAIMTAGIPFLRHPVLVPMVGLVAAYALYTVGW